MSFSVYDGLLDLQGFIIELPCGVVVYMIVFLPVNQWVHRKTLRFI